MKQNKIKELRNKKGLSQEDMAEFLHVSQNTFSMIETGKTRLVDVERIIILSEKFEVSPIELGLFDELMERLDYIKKNGEPEERNSAEKIIETLKTEIAIKNTQIEQVVLQNSQLLNLLSHRK
jgi:transcriptional regulator with XRE-family HTH domain